MPKVNIMRDGKLVAVDAAQFTQSFDDVKNQALREISTKRDALMVSGITFNGTRFQVRPEDEKRIAGMATLAMGAVLLGAAVGDLRWHGGPVDFAWIAENNSLVPMDAQTMFAFGKAVAARESSIIFHARTLKDAVAAATTQAALSLVNVATGWPS